MLVNSLNPDRIEGQKSVVGEILEQLGGVPDVIALPFGGGGNVSAVAAGLADAGVSPRIVVGQAAERATTWASAIRIGEPAHAEHVAGSSLQVASRLSRSPKGEMRTAWQQLATTEGLFCEPASAARPRRSSAPARRAGRDRRVHRHRARVGRRQAPSTLGGCDGSNRTLEAVVEVIR